MERELRLTEDGSHTVYVTGLDESYHSIHGALQESMHVFINQGFHTISRSPMHILEIGLGTGLNMMLTLIESEKIRIEVYYHAVEKYPLEPAEFGQLNFERIIDGIPSGSLLKMHEAPWGKQFNLTESFSIYKEQSDIRSMDPMGRFDLVYYDAFAPDKQPQLWTPNIFSKLYELINPGGILVSYTAKGSVRRDLVSCGFKVERVPGPPGKWEMIRATRI
ncbi:MAG: tRNA (5-methylaminomethyl-2-thiouridine)(34)-methyltransferase MnmD [Bacteroidales bacterium]|nr:tRNA (5-methylaminomethyl-2-thiouridine)(34)-methyltransferase MnmD [Bacteroidales bacterium]